MGTAFLTTGGGFAAIEKGLVEFFNHFEAIYGVEIFLFFVLIFCVSKVLRDNDATKLMLVYWSLIVIGGGLLVSGIADFLHKNLKLKWLLIITL